MKGKNKKPLLMLAIVLVLVTASFAIVYAESIGTVISAIMQRVTISFEGIGQDKAEASGKAMEGAAIDAKTSINGILNNAQNDLTSELDTYKNQQISLKNQELESLIRNVESSVNQKKAEKLDEYKQKIDEKINKEYEKLMKDLELN